jgi:prepilin signal peptidase PulO-like enzyme (type II secretory pathway)
VHGADGFFLPMMAILVCLLAALFDGWTRRIPNQLTYPAIVLGLALNGVLPLLEVLKLRSAAVWLGGVGWQSSGGGFLICAGLGVLACVAAGVHGGDIKLLAAVGAMLGFIETCNVLIVALLAAVVYAVLNLALFGGLNAVVSRMAMWVLEVIYLRRLEKPWGDDGLSKRASYIPMAVPLFVGILVAEIWRVKTMQGAG